jgi:hypothetical protein
MKTPQHSLLVLAFAFLLSSCASDLSTYHEGNDAGAVALSLEPGSTPIWGFALVLAAGPSPQPESPKAWVDWPKYHVYLTRRKPDFHDIQDGDGYVYLLHVRAGMYTIDSFNLRRSTNWYNRADPSSPLRVTVRPGRVVYIGSYRAQLENPSSDCGWYKLFKKTGGDTCSTFSVVLFDESKRDIEILKRLYPREPWGTISIELPAVASNPPTIVASPHLWGNN